MEVITPAATIVAYTPDMLKVIEGAARICYLSESKGKSPDEFIRDKIRRDHKSVLEHSSVTVDFVVDRGITHELVRHRIASFSQESSRYCNYSNGRFGGEISVIMPPFPEKNREDIWAEWFMACEAVEGAYMKMIELGCPAEIARSVLPTCTKAKIRITANIREWRHIFELRTSKAAHPQMREVMIPLLEEFKKLWPCLFGDIEPEMDKKVDTDAQLSLPY